VEIADDFGALHVEVVVVLLVGAFTNVAEVAVGIHITDEGEPGFAGGGAVGFFIEPAVFHAGDEGVGEHGGAGRLGPGFRPVNELAPHAVFTLEFEQRGHHTVITFENAWAERMIGGEFAEEFGEAGGKPTVAAAPEMRSVGRVVEEAVWLLQFVEVGDHFLCSAVEVFGVLGRAISLRLEDVDHVHVVDPVAGLRTQALRHERLSVAVLSGLFFPIGGEVWIGKSPLAVGFPLAEGEVTCIFILDIDLKRHRAEDGEVDVDRVGNEIGLGGGEERVEAFNETIEEVGVVGQLGEGERTVPSADFGIDNEPRVFWTTEVAMFAYDKVFCDELADLLRRGVFGPIAENFRTVCRDWFGSYNLQTGKGTKANGREKGAVRGTHEVS